MSSIQLFMHTFIQYWDKNIARIAEYYASTCPTGHDELRDVPGWLIYIFFVPSLIIGACLLLYFLS